MKKAFHVLIGCLVFGLCFFPRAWAQTPVVVELFTSEGCSSCPPADALLVQLSQKTPPGVDLILLGEHVDYRNHDGWSDRFSSSQFSQRQSDYEEHLHVAGPYTPQMVIDGHLQFVGNDVAALQHNLELASAQPKIAQVSVQWEAGEPSEDRGAGPGENSCPRFSGHNRGRTDYRDRWRRKQRPDLATCGGRAGVARAEQREERIV